MSRWRGLGFVPVVVVFLWVVDHGRGLRVADQCNLLLVRKCCSTRRKRWMTDKRTNEVVVICNPRHRRRRRQPTCPCNMFIINFSR
jgi:hypothetical protein